MRHRLQIPLLWAILLLPLSVHAQDEGRVTAELRADLVSQYLWRGQPLGNASLQPAVALDWKGLSLEAWGSIGVADAADPREIDLTLSYTFHDITLGLTDYWSTGSDPHYFFFRKPGTSHVLEAFAAYELGPVQLGWHTNIAGADAETPDGDPAWSSYAEISLPFEWADCDWEAALGIVPFATDYYEVKGFAVTNVSLKVERSIALADKLTLPLSVQLIANPYSRHLYLVGGVSLVVGNK
ncbi:MAG: hypothetical protein J5641_03440 [Bacteroidales bacterium]|nr:hypothetical protein [Bacteroidales bacterium]